MNNEHSKKYDVVISYSHSDKVLAYAIREELALNNIMAFISALDLNGGTEFQDFITTTIASSKIVLYLCSENSSQSSWVTNEIRYAIRNNITVLPVIINQTEPSEELSTYLDSALYIHYDSSTHTRDLGNIISKTTTVYEQKHSENIAIHAPEATCDKETKIDYTSHLKPKPTPISPTTTPDTPRKKNKKQADIGEYVGLVFFLMGLISFTFGILVYNGVFEGITDSFPFFFLGGIPLIGGPFVLISAKYNHKITIYCNTDKRSHNSLIKINVGNREAAKLSGKGVAEFYLYGRNKHLIHITSEDSDIEDFTFEYDTNEAEDDIIYVTLKCHTSTSNISTTPIDITNFRCFIAGSTRLVNERNATRATLSVLYNKWEKHKLVISSYTFEDFSMGYTIGGQQMQYNEFIENKANCAIFIIENGVGEKTLEEYQLAIKTFKENLNRPKIFVYTCNLNTEEHLTTKTFIEEIKKNRSYWREYNDIKQLMSQIEKDIDAELFNIFVFKNNL